MASMPDASRSSPSQPIGVSLSNRLKLLPCADDILGIGLKIVKGMPVTKGNALVGEASELTNLLLQSHAPIDKANLIGDRFEMLKWVKMPRDPAGFYTAHYINRLSKGHGLLACILNVTCDLKPGTTNSFEQPKGIIVAMQAPSQFHDVVNWLIDFYEAIEFRVGPLYIAEWGLRASQLKLKGLPVDEYHEKYGEDPLFHGFILEARRAVLVDFLYEVIDTTSEKRNVHALNMGQAINKKAHPARAILDAEDITGLVYFERARKILRAMNQTILDARVVMGLKMEHGLGSN